ncbi:MAG: vWA domain-containing protein [Chlamydiota bacterium]
MSLFLRHCKAIVTAFFSFLLINPTNYSIASAAHPIIEDLPSERPVVDLSSRRQLLNLKMIKSKAAKPCLKYCPQIESDAILRVEFNFPFLPIFTASPPLLPNFSVASFALPLCKPATRPFYHSSQHFPLPAAASSVKAFGLKPTNRLWFTSSTLKANSSLFFSPLLEPVPSLTPLAISYYSSLSQPTSPYLYSLKNLSQVSVPFKTIPCSPQTRPTSALQSHVLPKLSFLLAPLKVPIKQPVASPQKELPKPFILGLQAPPKLPPLVGAQIIAFNQSPASLSLTVRPSTPHPHLFSLARSAALKWRSFTLAIQFKATSSTLDPQQPALEEVSLISYADAQFPSFFFSSPPSRIAYQLELPPPKLFKPYFPPKKNAFSSASFLFAPSAFPISNQIVAKPPLTPAAPFLFPESHFFVSPATFSVAVNTFIHRPQLPIDTSLAHQDRCYRIPLLQSHFSPKKPQLYFTFLSFDCSLLTDNLMAEAKPLLSLSTARHPLSEPTSLVFSHTLPSAGMKQAYFFHRPTFLAFTFQRAVSYFLLSRPHLFPAKRLKKSPALFSFPCSLSARKTVTTAPAPKLLPDLEPTAYCPGPTVTPVQFSIGTKPTFLSPLVLQRPFIALCPTQVQTAKRRFNLKRLFAPPLKVLFSSFSVRTVEKEQIATYPLLETGWDKPDAALDFSPTLFAFAVSSECDLSLPSVSVLPSFLDIDSIHAKVALNPAFPMGNQRFEKRPLLFYQDLDTASPPIKHFPKLEMAYFATCLPKAPFLIASLPKSLFRLQLAYSTFAPSLSEGIFSQPKKRSFSFSPSLFYDELLRIFSTPRWESIALTSPTLSAPFFELIQSSASPFTYRKSNLTPPSIALSPKDLPKLATASTYTPLFYYNQPSPRHLLLNRLTSCMTWPLSHLFLPPYLARFSWESSLYTPKPLSASLSNHHIQKSQPAIRKRALLAIIALPPFEQPLFNLHLIAFTLLDLPMLSSFSQNKSTAFLASLHRNHQLFTDPASNQFALDDFIAIFKDALFAIPQEQEVAADAFGLAISPQDLKGPKTGDIRSNDQQLIQLYRKAYCTAEIPQLIQPVLSTGYRDKFAQSTNTKARYTRGYLASLPTPTDLQTFSLTNAFETTLRYTKCKNRKGYLFALDIKPNKDISFPSPEQNFIFVIDGSGTINRNRFKAFKEGVSKALNYLRAGDSFNIVVVDAKATVMNEKPIPWSKKTARYARRFLQKKEYRGFFSFDDAFSLINVAANYFAADKRNVVILMTDGRSLSTIKAHSKDFADLYKYSDHKFSLFTASASKQNNLAMLDLISTFNSGELMYSPTYAAFPRKLAILVKHIENSIASQVCIQPASLSAADIAFYPNANALPVLYSDRTYTIYGTIDHLDSFDLLLQGRGTNYWINIKQHISFRNAKKGGRSLERNFAQQQAYVCYHDYLLREDPFFLAEAEKILKPYALPCATR